MLSSEDANSSVAGGKGVVVIKGETFLIDPITDQSTATLHNYFRRTMKSPLAAVAESLKGLPEEMQRMIIAEAVKIQVGGGSDANAAFYRDKMLSADGCGFLFWLLAKENHPDLTHAKCTALAESATPEMLMAELGKASGLLSLSDRGN